MKKEYLWGWIVGKCDKCCKKNSQMPIVDEIGEDSNLYTELKKLRAKGDRCGCGGEMFYRVDGITKMS